MQSIMKKKNPNLCEIKGCYNESGLVYYKHQVCLKHFHAYCEDRFNLKCVFKVENKNMAQKGLKLDKQEVLI